MEPVDSLDVTERLDRKEREHKGHPMGEGPTGEPRVIQPARPAGPRHVPKTALQRFQTALPALFAQLQRERPFDPATVATERYRAQLAAQSAARAAGRAVDPVTQLTAFEAEEAVWSERYQCLMLKYAGSALALSSAHKVGTATFTSLVGDATQLYAAQEGAVWTMNKATQRSAVLIKAGKGHNPRILAVANNRLFTANGSNEIHAWNPQNGAHVGTITTKQPAHLLTSSGNELISGSTTGTITHVNTSTMKETSSVSPRWSEVSEVWTHNNEIVGDRETGRFRSVAIVPTVTTISYATGPMTALAVTGSDVYAGFASGVILVARNGTAPTVFSEHRTSVTALLLYHDLLFIGYADGTIQESNRHTGEVYLATKIGSDGQLPEEAAAALERTRLLKQAMDAAQQLAQTTAAKANEIAKDRGQPVPQHTEDELTQATRESIAAHAAYEKAKSKYDSTMTSKKAAAEMRPITGLSLFNEEALYASSDQGAILRFDLRKPLESIVAPGVDRGNSFALSVAHNQSILQPEKPSAASATSATRATTIKSRRNVIVMSVVVFLVAAVISAWNRSRA